MTYSTTTELTNITGSSLSSTILRAIIDDGDREIDAYLLNYGVSGTASGACKSASLKLAQAGLLYYGLQTGTLQATSGDFTSSVDVTRAAEVLRQAAFTLLDRYIGTQSASATNNIFVRAVHGR